jgi:hypothetical protein
MLIAPSQSKTPNHASHAVFFCLSCLNHLLLDFLLGNNMRYEDWDILIFPKGSSAPVKEFKVACHVVHDVGM